MPPSCRRSPPHGRENPPQSGHTPRVTRRPFGPNVPQRRPSAGLRTPPPSSRPPQVPVPPTRASSSAGTLRLRKPEASGPAPARLPDGQPSVRVTQASFFGDTQNGNDPLYGAHDGLLAHARPLHGRTDAARGVLRRERNPSAHQAASGRRPRRLQQGLGLCSRARHRAPLGLRGPSVLVGRAWRTWVDAVSALAYVAAGLPFIYVGLLEAASSPAAGRPSGRDARPSRRWSSISSSPTPPWSSGCSIPCSSAGGLRTTCT